MIPHDHENVMENSGDKRKHIMTVRTLTAGTPFTNMDLSIVKWLHP